MRASEGLLVGSLPRDRFGADFFARTGFFARGAVLERGLDFLALSFFFVFALGAALDFFLRLGFFLAMQKV